ncbi:MAG: RNA-binding S4 domain-containing protein [Anderseniella sp.]
MARSAPETTPCTQRIDRWLWFTRFVKTRALAQRLVAGGKVRINKTKITKSSQTVAPGDVVSFMAHDRIHVVRVELPGERRGPAPEARKLYTDLNVKNEQSEPAQDD